MSLGFGLCGLILFVCGYLLGPGKRPDLLAGFDPNAYQDPYAVGRFFGRHLMAMGTACLLLAGARWLFPGLQAFESGIGLTATISLLAWLMALLFGGKKFARK